MSIGTRTIACLIIASLAAALSAAQTSMAAPATQPVPLPTLAELQGMHDSGDYRTCLQQIARLLALRGPPAAQYDSNALLLLRGDCLVHEKDPATALGAYTAAMKSPEPRQAAEARAMSLLIRNSPGLVFKPVSPPDAAPVDIVDHQKRKAAMIALMEKLRRDNKALIDSALDAQTLVPIMNAAPILIDVYSLEVTATGSDTQTRPTLVALGERARDLISRELAIVDQRISIIEQKADQAITVGIGGPWWSATARQGLTTDDRAALRDNADYADKITATTTDFRRIAKSLGSTGEKWEPIIDKGVEVAQHARSVLLAE